MKTKLSESINTHKANRSTKREIERLRKKIAIGSKQADRGEFVDGNTVFDEIRRRSDQRKRAME
jgi:hypothetical protein